MEGDDAGRSAFWQEVQVGAPDDVHRFSEQLLERRAAGEEDEEIENAVHHASVHVNDITFARKISKSFFGNGSASVRRAGCEDHKPVLRVRCRHGAQKRERVPSDAARFSSRQVSCIHAYSHRWV